MKWYWIAAIVVVSIGVGYYVGKTMSKPADKKGTAGTGSGVQNTTNSAAA